MTLHRYTLAFLLATTLAVPWIAQADSGLGRHKKMYAVPVPGKVVIDGKLDDWDLSGQILMYVISETSEMQGARFALMYDQDALYISGDVRDASPMMNRHTRTAASSASCSTPPRATRPRAARTRRASRTRTTRWRT